MRSQDTWELIEAKMVELRILTEANWKHAEWELAALGERVLRTVEINKAESESLRMDTVIMQKSLAELKRKFDGQTAFEKE